VNAEARSSNIKTKAKSTYVNNVHKATVIKHGDRHRSHVRRTLRASSDTLCGQNFWRVRTRKGFAEVAGESGV
jgi:hypothetical protein